MSETQTRAPRRPGRSVRATWWYTWSSVALMIVVLNAAAGVWLGVLGPAPIAVRAALIALVALCTVLQLRFSLLHRAGLFSGAADARAVATLMVPAAVTSLACLATAPRLLAGALPLSLALSVLAAERPRPWCAPLSVAVVAALIVHSAIGSRLGPAPGAHPSPELLDQAARSTVFLALFALATILLSVWLWGVVQRLDEARSAEADLAVARERLRFAADLHDIQGHHLQVIALQAELAERLLEPDPEAARQKLRETREIARQALEETRGLVQGLRQVSLAQELDNAADVLGAAGIDCRRHAGPEPQDPQIRRVLGLAVREATTNLLRHARAESASYELTLESDAAGGTTWRLEVANDGAAPARDTSPGTGLRGLRERAESLGGSLTVHQDDGRFAVEVLLPQPDPERTTT